MSGVSGREERDVRCQVLVEREYLEEMKIDPLSPRYAEAVGKPTYLPLRTLFPKLWL